MVAEQHQRGHSATADEACPKQRFIADAMLGKLARWLRMLGVDTVYEPSLNDTELLERSIEEDRVLLTRDFRLTQRKLARNCSLIESDCWKEQLRQVVCEFHLTTDPAENGKRFSRCVGCNGRLEPVDREAVRFRVPVHIHEEHERFLRCLHCKHIYWQGSHHAAVERVLDELMDVRRP